MNGLASSLAEIEALKGLTGTATCDIVVCPPFTLIEKAAYTAKDSIVTTGAQDRHSLASGAYTGDVSADLLAEAGARVAILAHSRHEADAAITAKAAAAHRTGLTSIVSAGETRKQRVEGKALEVVRAQLEGSVPRGATSSNTIIAYEPVRTIGTGLVPTVEQVEEVHAAIRQVLEVRLDDDGRRVRILCGGSVKASNAAAIFEARDVGGALAGGASLKASEFAGIMSAAV